MLNYFYLKFNIIDQTEPLIIIIIIIIILILFN